MTKKLKWQARRDRLQGLRFRKLAERVISITKPTLVILAAEEATTVWKRRQ